MMVSSDDASLEGMALITLFIIPESDDRRILEYGGMIPGKFNIRCMRK